MYYAFLNGAAVDACVLVVDDDRLITTMISALLKSEGYEVVQAFSGEEARERVCAQPPDMILCDLAMPGMDGFELLRWVRGDPHLRHIPFIILTAHGEAENRTEAFRLGADEFLVKPFSTSELLSKVKQLLARTSSQEE